MTDLEFTNDLSILEELLKAIKKDNSTTDEEKNDFLIRLFGDVERELTCNQTILFIYLLYHSADENNHVGHTYIINIIEIYERYLSSTQARDMWRKFLTNEVKVIKILREKSFKLVKRILASVANIFELCNEDIRSHLQETLSLMAVKPESNGFFFWSDYFEIYDAIGLQIYALFVLKKKKIKAENVKIMEFFDRIDENNRNRIIQFFDRLIPVDIPFNKYQEFFSKKLRQLAIRYSDQYQYLENIHDIIELKMIEKLISNIVKRFDVKKEIIIHTYIYKMMFRLLFHYGGYMKGIRNGESSTAFVNFYQHVLSDLGNCPDAFQTFIETFYDMRHGEEICFFTIIFMPKLKNFINKKSIGFFNDENAMLNYNSKFKNLIQYNGNIKELYSRTRQEVITTEKLEPVTKIFNKIDVYLVETEDHFKEALLWLYDAKVIAVDTEFLPDIVGGGLCLCQVAIPNGVLIFDAEKVSVRKSCWKELLKFLFISSTCPILFFDYKNDYKVLSTILNDTEEKSFKNSFKRIIDVQFLYINSLKEPVFRKFLKENYIEEIDKVSLKDVAKSVTGLDMEKEFQYAPWRMRPLPLDMIKYAATDALILILIYKKIKEIIKDDALFAKLEDINGDFSQSKISTSNDTFSKDSGKLNKKKESSTISEIVQHIKNDTELKAFSKSPKDFTLYVDSMILNLQPILLNLGFNIYTKETKNYGALKNVNITIISVGKAINQWKKNNRYNRIISLKYTDSLEDKILYIFKQLEVELDEKLIGQKCINCQGSDIVIVSRLLLLFMYYDAFLGDTENHKHVTKFDEINEETLEKDLNEEKEIGFYNSENGFYFSNDFIIDVKNKKIVFLSEKKWKDLPSQKQNAFLKIYYTPNDFMLCRDCNTFSARHKI